MPLLRQGIDVVGGKPVPRVSRPGCPAEAGSWRDPVAELVTVTEAGNSGIGKHTLRTVVHEIMLAEQCVVLTGTCILL